MGDRVRQLLYPLLLPAIVAVIWFSGWVRQMDDRMGPSSLQPVSTLHRGAERRHDAADLAGADAVPFVDESDVMATAGDEPVIEY